MSLLAALLLAGASVCAWAVWSAGSSATSRGAAVAASVNQGATPTASASPGRTVTISWGASTLSNGHGVDGYVVKRYDAGGGSPQTTLSGCSGTISGLACIESGVPVGQWTYSVTPVIAANWRGADSVKSGVVTISSATLALAKTLFGAPLPQNTTGSLAGFAANEGVSFRLDSNTTLTAAPSSVGSAGTATVSSLSIASAGDGPHTVYALGDASPFASQASVGIVTDTTAPAVSAQLTPAPDAGGWNSTSPVQVALSANDAGGSGVQHITYTSDGSDPATSGTAVVYSIPLSFTASTTVKYIAVDVAGNSSTVHTQLVRIDAIAPSGGAVDASGLGGTGGRYSASTTLTVTLAKGTDGGSGLAASGARLLRSSATLSSDGSSNGACGAYGTAVQVGATDPASPATDTVPAGNTCYRYQYVVADNAANATTYTSGDIKVDATPPTTPALTFSAFNNTAAVGTIVYYRPSASGGAVTITGASVDATSGVASYAFPALGSGWSSSSGGPGVTTYSYGAPNPSPPSGGQNVTTTNHAGLQSTAAAFTVAADSAAPSGGAITYTSGYQTSPTVSVGLPSSSDGGSGIDAASGVLQRASASLVADVCATLGGFSTIATNPTSPYPDSGGSNGNCYQYRYLISDAVGNQTTYTSANVVKLDTQPPAQTFSLTNAVGASLSGSTLYYKGDATGSFKLVDTLSDPASGVASATFPAVATTGWTHAAETLSTPSGGPYTSATYSWTAGPANPTGYAVTGVDSATNAGAAGIAFTSDTTAPAGGSVGYADAVYNALSVPITTTNGSDAQSGISSASGIVKRDVATLTPASETCGAFPGTFPTTVTLVAGADTTVTSGHCYKYAYSIADNVGNQATYTAGTVAKVDTSGPRVTAIASLDPLGAAPTGLLQVGAKLILTFNQSLAAASVPTSFTGATETRASSLVFVAAPNVFLTIPGISAGARDTGSAGPPHA